MKKLHPAIKSVSSTDHKTTRIRPAVKGEGFQNGGFATIIVGEERIPANEAACRLQSQPDLLAAAKRALIVLEGIVTIRRQGDTLDELSSAIADAEL